MPQLIFKGVSVEQVKKISTPLVEELAEFCECDTDNFTFEIVDSIFVFNGEEVPGFPFIEVKWFDRGQKVQDEVAAITTKYIHFIGIPEVEIAFSVFSEAAYYLNGKSFA